MKSLKKVFYTYITIIAISLLSLHLHANPNYKKTTINNTECYIYYVAQGEGFYSLTKKFGVTRDEIVRFNPSAKTGLNRGQKLYIPVINEENSNKKKNPENCYLPTIHVVSKSESLYSIAKKYNISVDEIKELNSLKSNNIRVGQELIVSKYNNAILSETTNDEETDKENVIINDNKVIIDGVTYNTEKYVVKNKETLYSISQKFNTTVDAILACNPNIKSLRRNDVINIPLTKEVVNVINEYEAENKNVVINNSAENVIIDEVGKTNLNIAVILPFNLKHNTPQSQMYIDYYKGLLMALDSLKSLGLCANVYSFDTEGETYKTSAILSKPEMKEMDIIFGPDKNEDIKIIGEFARKNGIYLVNSFSVKNNEYEINKNIIQGHIPSSLFFAAATKAFIEKNSNKEIIFLIDNNEPNDKQEFVDTIAEGIKQTGREYKKFNFNEVTDFEVLSESIADNSDIVLVASSSTRSGVAKTIAIASRIKDTRLNVNVSVFGFPEWQTYIKDYLETFHSLNTTLFTRFYTEPTKNQWKEFNKEYSYWFGDKKSAMIPSPNLLGFDTGIYLIGGMMRHSENFEQYLETITSKSLQTDFAFERLSENGGYVNRNLYFVTFTPEYKIIKEIIK